MSRKINSKTNLVCKKRRKNVRGLIQLKKKVTAFLFLSGMTLAGSWSVDGGAHIYAFTFFMVLELSRSLSVVSNAHIQAFAQKLAHVLDSLVRTVKKRGCGHVHPC